MIYLDYQATTPVAPEAAKAMAPWIEYKFANPHSPSKWWREADAAIEVARKQVEEAIGRKGGSVAFTGSATEAINWALKGTAEKAAAGRNRIITIATEHAAVLDSCEWLAGRGFDLTVLPVGADGILDLDLLERELDQRDSECGPLDRLLGRLRPRLPGGSPQAQPERAGRGPGEEARKDAVGLPGAREEALRV